MNLDRLTAPSNNEASSGTSALSTGLCSMVIIETPTFACLWECSECKAQYKATKKFYGNKSCPNCGKAISNWFGEDDAFDA